MLPTKFGDGLLQRDALVAGVHVVQRLPDALDVVRARRIAFILGLSEVEGLVQRRLTAHEPGTREIAKGAKVVDPINRHGLPLSYHSILTNSRRTYSPRFMALAPAKIPGIHPHGIARRHSRAASASRRARSGWASARL